MSEIVEFDILCFKFLIFCAVSSYMALWIAMWYGRSSPTELGFKESHEGQTWIGLHVRMNMDSLRRENCCHWNPKWTSPDRTKIRQTLKDSSRLWFYTVKRENVAIGIEVMLTVGKVGFKWLSFVGRGMWRMAVFSTNPGGPMSSEFEMREI